MQRITDELRQIVDEYANKISSIPDNVFSAKLTPNKWSKKEVLGHLIDSAHNNLRRFITGQYELVPPHIIYDQDFWVEANDYTFSKREDVVALWKLMNERICVVLSTMPQQNYLRTCNTGKGSEQLHSLEFLAVDYVKHLKHHINQIIPDSFDVVYK